jgi:hypothetical protein
MLLSISSGISFLYLIAGLMAALASLFGYINRPWTEKSKRHRQQKKIIKLFMNGDPGIKGLIETVIPGPERVAAAEQAIKEHTGLLKSLDLTQKEQGRALKKVEDGLLGLTTVIVQLDKKITGNGGNTNNLGDIMMRQAKRNGDWLFEVDKIHNSLDPKLFDLDDKSDSQNSSTDKTSNG